MQYLSQGDRPKLPQMRLNVRSLVESQDWAIGREVMRAFCEIDPRFRPERHIDTVKDDLRFVKKFTSVEELKPYWAPALSGYLDDGSRFKFTPQLDFKRDRSIKYEASFRHPHVNRKGGRSGASLSMFAKWNKTAPWRTLFERLVRVLRAEIGMLHLYSDPEYDELEGQAWFRGGTLAYVDGASRAQNLGWEMYFGPVLSRELDFEKLSHWGDLQEKTEEGVFLRVTEDISDVKDRHAYFSEKREELKSLLPSGFLRGTP